MDCTALCPPDAFPVDLDGDDCPDTCKKCLPGHVPVGAGPDGCADGCEPCPDIECPAGTEPVDEDGNGCADSCQCSDGTQAVAIDGQFAPCECDFQCDPGVCGLPGMVQVDLDGDDCPDGCEACPPGFKAVDTGEDGCGDECVECPVLVCPLGGEPFDETGDGCADTCLCALPGSADATAGDLIAPCSCPDTAVCPPSSEAIDSDADSCPDKCLCPSGIAILAGELCPCAAEVTCDSEASPVDTDQDGCADTCQCDDGSEPGPTGLCGCPAFDDCPPGLIPVDTDGDTCPDSCDCLVPGTCGCTGPELLCLPGTILADTTKDGCADKCLAACAHDCDCYGLGIALSIECGNAQWTCSASGECVEACAADAALAQVCAACPSSPSCGPGEAPVDIDGDDCPDVCECLTGLDKDGSCGCAEVLSCFVGSVSTDTDDDGCPDACVCEEPDQVPNADGICCPETPACPDGAILHDSDQDGCFDTCLCGAGDPVADDGTCPCQKSVDCGGDLTPVDLDDDGCADACVCPADTVPAASGACCEAAAPECPTNAELVDASGDGCPDTCACLNGQPLEADGTCGCGGLDVLCAPGTSAFDLDADGCEETCLCPDGSKPSDDGTCGQDCSEFVCEADMPVYSWLVDKDGDGCYDFTDVCEGGTQGADTNGDGCNDVCNPCDAAVACDAGSAAVDTDGDNCPDACESVACDSSSQCPDGSWCQKAAFECDSVGTCAPLEPELTCPAVFDPVCGCPGAAGEATTYTSSCVAKQEGANIGSAGACPGAPCTSTDECGSDALFCQFLDGVCGGEGKCAEVPVACADDNPFVCVVGCDGATYPTACDAHGAGLSLKQTDASCMGCANVVCMAGSGTEPVDTTGDGCNDKCLVPCAASGDCGDAGLACKLPHGVCGGTGHCYPAVEVCPTDAPVCGCDGLTYAHGCDAAEDGVVALTDGPCEGAVDCKSECECYDSSTFAELCAGGDNLWKCDAGQCIEACDPSFQDVVAACFPSTPCDNADGCEADQFCARPEGKCDELGTCQDKPATCDVQATLVCGCDGVTYESACQANGVGTSIESSGGACTQQ